jgi:hypothetical protein
LKSSGSGNPIVATTVSDHNGGFAFINMPAGRCYTLQTPAAAGFGRSSYTTYFDRGATYELTEEVFATEQFTVDPPCGSPSD